MSRVVRGPTAFNENGGLLCRDLLFCQASLPLHRCMGLYSHTDRPCGIKQLPIQGSHQ